jgi:predicted HTH transcriptional regulator
MSSEQYIRRLIAQGEHQQLDFKFEVEDARKIAKSMVAFANTDGGRLLIGVKDNGKIVGIDSEEEMYVIEGAAELYSEPPVALEATLHKVENKSVLEIHVPVSETKHKAKVLNGRSVAFIRKDDMNLQATRVHTRIWDLHTEMKGRKFDYGKNEEKLFHYLKEHGGITLSKYCRITRMHYRKATDKLARMVIWEVIDMDFSEKGCFFRLGEYSEELLENKESENLSKD